MKKSSVLRKSPLHPSALGLNDLFVGQRITRFNMEHGRMGNFIVLRKPYIGIHDGVLSYAGQSEQDHLILLRSLHIFPESSGLSEASYQSTEMFVADMGITPRNIVNSRPFWSPTNFVIDSRKEHLLPSFDRR